MTEKSSVVARAMTIPEFCAAWNISPQMYWKLQRQGKGPRTMKIGSCVRITPEASEEWGRDQQCAQ